MLTTLHMEAPFGCVAVSVSTKGVTFLDVLLPTQLNPGPGRRRRQEERANKREMRPSDYDGRRCQFVTLPHLSVG